jgi:Holliday junction DNA helicase RuvB
MNLQKLVGFIRKSNEGARFGEIIGYNHIKRLFKLTIESETRTHILLVGPPASAKTMFLTSLLRFLKNAYFIDGANATKAGVIDYLFENHPRYLLIDEIDKLQPKHQTFLLNLLETGIISETKYRKTREMKIDVSVFATCNDPRKLSDALRSRFFVVQIEPYEYDQFYQITISLLKNQIEFAPAIVDVVWRTSRNIRDCLRIGKLARSQGDVKFLLDNFIVTHNGVGS